jgi:hypothetical protein
MKAGVWRWAVLVALFLGATIIGFALMYDSFVYVLHTLRPDGTRPPCSTSIGITSDLGRWCERLVGVLIYAIGTAKVIINAFARKEL